jgi:hypothetical protein
MCVRCAIDRRSRLIHALDSQKVKLRERVEGENGGSCTAPAGEGGARAELRLHLATQIPRCGEDSCCWAPCCSSRERQRARRVRGSTAAEQQLWESTSLSSATVEERRVVTRAAASYKSRPDAATRASVARACTHAVCAGSTASPARHQAVAERAAASTVSISTQTRMRARTAAASATTATSSIRTIAYQAAAAAGQRHHVGRTRPRRGAAACATLGIVSTPREPAVRARQEAVAMPGAGRHMRVRIRQRVR